MKKELLQVSLRYKAVFIANTTSNKVKTPLTQSTINLVANVAKLGFVFDENLLRAINQQTPKLQLVLLETLKEVTGVKKNWTPLVKAWNIPTKETRIDHIITYLSNLVGNPKGTLLHCGHRIPSGTFPLERYNGCPFCGTTFEFGKLEYTNQGSTKKVLSLWTEEEINEVYTSLLASKTALDATQIDSLKLLIKNFEIPKSVVIGIKETLLLVIEALINADKAIEASKLFKTPTDILRYLWYKHTGYLQIVKPKVVVERMRKNVGFYSTSTTLNIATKQKATNELKLKYTRKEGKMVAYWLNNLPLSAEKACEIMHAKRGMWVRFIRALRLAEYSKRKGFENLKDLLDVFYNQTYEVYEGRIQQYRLKMDVAQTFALLKKRPGLFARSLFANMLWFGADVTLVHFKEILDEVPARLLITLNMYANIYFNKGASRTVKPLGGTSKRIPANKLLAIYSEEQLAMMKSQIEDLCIEKIAQRFANQENDNNAMYIAEALYRIPLAIGDRSETVQDLPAALMGQRFALESDQVRLFMQWGEGLPAQHLDMDLSCKVAYENSTEFCSYSQLSIAGCKHSGDIQRIPNKVGTAEYIELDIATLRAKKAKYVSFTCNAYTSGSLTPNLVVGWMNSKHPMRISNRTGVAYDPSCVQHQVRITQGITKGLVFGILDVAANEIVWLEMSFGGQVVQGLDTKGVEALLAKLDSKMNIGNLLELKAKAQNLTIVKNALEADETYDAKWAIDSAKVTQLFVD